MLLATKQKRRVLENQPEVLDLTIHGSEPQVVQNTKYLCVQIDSSLDWKEKIKAVSVKVSRALGFLKHAKNFLPRETLRTLYKGIVEPHFRYCCSLWGCAGSTEIKQLQKLRNRAARIVTNSSYDASSKKLLEELGWNTIDELITIESEIMVYKSLNGLAPQYLFDFFTRNSTLSSHCFGNTETDFRLPLKRTSNGQKCFSYRGAKLWNSLSAESKHAPSLNIFKQSI